MALAPGFTKEGQNIVQWNVYKNNVCFDCFLGLFHHAIAESGTANAMWATHHTEANLRDDVETFSRAHHCYEGEDEEDLVECLQTIPYEKFSTTSSICTVYNM